jgi:hypothetical protein
MEGVKWALGLWVLDRIGMGRNGWVFGCVSSIVGFEVRDCNCNGVKELREDVWCLSRIGSSGVK